MTKPAQHDGDEGSSVRLACAFAAAQFGLHAWFALSAGDPRMLMPHVIAWIWDVNLLTIVTAALWGLSAMSIRFGASRRFATVLGNLALIAFGLLLASYPGLLTEFLAFPVNILRADIGTSWFVVKDCIGWYGLWPLAVSLLASGWALGSDWCPPSPRKIMRVVAPVMILSTATLLGPSPQPIVYSMQDSVRDWVLSGGRKVPSLSRPTGAMLTNTQPAVELTPLEETAPLHFDHVLVIVFETVTTTRFERAFSQIPGGYFAKVRDRSVFFDRYYTTNLDSYTSLIAMLRGVSVPYRAYANPSKYESVNDGSNLVGLLREAGFESLFVCTSEHSPFIPVRKEWDRIMGQRDLPRKDRWVTVGGSRVESAVEDRAAISTILNFVKSHGRTFVMHEMVFGHSPRWMAKTGKTQMEYYSQYLLELLDGLERAGEADRTLVVTLADHGNRAEAANPENYRVPLLITGRGIARERVSAFLSHKDLSGIILHFLADRPLPEANDALLTVGSTERWVYGEITQQGDYLFIDNNTGAVLSDRGANNPQAVYASFQHDLNVFAAQYQR